MYVAILSVINYQFQEKNQFNNFLLRDKNLHWDISPVSWGE